MPRDYWVPFGPTAETLAVDVFELTPAANKLIEILEIIIGQTTELGDAAEEQLVLDIIRGHTTSGSGGAAVTPTPVDPNDPAAGFVAETLNTTQATVGTTTVGPRIPWNVRTGLERIWAPGEGPKAHAGNTTIVGRLNAAPADSITLAGYLKVREY